MLSGDPNILGRSEQEFSRTVSPAFFRSSPEGQPRLWDPASPREE